MSRIRFLLDENTAHAIGDQLLRRQPEIDILAIGTNPAPAIGTLDPDLLIWLEREAYCLVTRNRRSMPGHLHDHLIAGHHIPGIFTLRPKAAMGVVIEELLLIWAAAAVDEYRDQIVYIPL